MQSCYLPSFPIHYHIFSLPIPLPLCIAMLFEPCWHVHLLHCRQGAKAPLMDYHEVVLPVGSKRSRASDNGCSFFCVVVQNVLLLLRLKKLVSQVGCTNSFLIGCGPRAKHFFQHNIISNIELN